MTQETKGNNKIFLDSKMMGKKGKEHVKENFLVTKHLKKYLNLFLSLTESH